MATYTSADGSTFTDEDLERWGNEAETGVPYDGKHLGSSVACRPISVGVGAKPFTLRLDRSRRAKLAEVAQERGTTPYPPPKTGHHDDSPASNNDELP